MSIAPPSPVAHVVHVDEARYLLQEIGGGGRMRRRGRGSDQAVRSTKCNGQRLKSSKLDPHLTAVVQF